MKSTINDVAREAGVSITTVSRVLNKNYPVKEETRIKIEEVIEKLNYVPNNMARSLITKRSSTIGVIIPGITNIFFSTIVQAIQDDLKINGYNITLSNTDGEAEEEAIIVNELINRNVDGLIVIDPSMDNLKNKLFENVTKTIPTIIVNGYQGNKKFNFVCYDEEVGTCDALEYLYNLEHEKIAFVRGHKSYSYKIKEDIYMNFIQEKSLSYERIINVGKGNTIEVVERTQNIIEEVLLEEDKPTAIFACNDLMAIGVLNACNKLNIKVPEDISIVGFDNTIFSSVTHPKLTTVDLNMKEIGRRVANEILDMINNESNIRKKVILDTSLVVRESCAKAKDKNKF